MNAFDRLRMPVLLDGITSAVYRSFGMPEEAHVEKWISEHPEVLVQVAQAYADAGSRIVCAPTFLTKLHYASQEELEGERLSLSARLMHMTRQALQDHDTLAGGSMYSAGLAFEPFGDMEFVRLVELYARQAHTLAQSGAQLIAVLGMHSLGECRAALLGARRTGLPVVVSVCCDREGKTEWGDDVLACLLVLQDMGLAAFGIEGLHGPQDLLASIERLAPYAKIPLLTRPSTGSPPLTPVQFSDRCAKLLREGVSMIGGANGVTPEHIVALNHMLGGFDIDRVRVEPAQYDILTASRGIYYLNDALEYSEPITCELDMGDVLLELSHESCDAALIRLDTPDDGYHFSLNAHLLDMPAAFESESLEALESALLHYHGKAIVVSTSCEIEKEQLQTLAARYGAIVL